MFQIPSPIQQLNCELLSKHNVELFIKRDDLIHNVVSGNKWRKLQSYLALAQAQSKDVMSFGGAYSNHLHALAYACAQLKLKVSAIIRGDQTTSLNPTLLDCQAQGMAFQFVDRKTYQLRYDSQFLSDLQQANPNSLIIPEGGYGQPAIESVAQLVSEIDIDFDTIVCPVGSGTTLAGVISALKPHQQAIGVCAIAKGEYLAQQIADLVPKTSKNWQLWTEFHLGGFAKLSPELLAFVKDFYHTHQICLDPIYTSKTVRALFEKISTNAFNGQKIVLIHTGGVQGWRGFEQRGLVNINSLFGDILL
ncbi:1-aminocyclopropane-1-carboxylate deaminase/D-cysteine desulfhydrase [Catenovulum maritimum]|uniref:Tryptophan synthase beta chain-like PALP domain-containing protein n=1 Tax=Catenovulum maritimum TaxID=1513271 RepID=A0A0J8GXT5_9ALTE|nr:pyridoxal-phosphate dependent enzyme [Catenovulum maritimum]KMT66039.1 hypothetical protein XM47_06215 [Catenovulum maritimum]